ncbi:MarR family winged helix-turn-helix transcriptional regulator [Microbacterium sp. NPDC090225]|uniref:MarR family winged helix-turn-helix transcriptional regulator n=1 Tax=Microbacterium sp. NPDC090225 TaxID=3364207 RepID=UPI0038075E5F
MNDDARKARESIEALTIAISVRSVPLILGSLLETNLTIQQLKILTTIVVNDGATISALASEFKTSLAAVSKIADRLVAQGLVARVTDTQDHRVKRLLPTGLGRDVVGSVVAARPELGSDVLDGLSQDELDALVTALRAINREMKAPPSWSEA